MVLTALPLVLLPTGDVRKHHGLMEPHLPLCEPSLDEAHQRAATTGSSRHTRVTCSRVTRTKYKAGESGGQGP